MSIIRGTTPTIRYTFRVVDPSNIVAAYLTMKQCGSNVVERDISTMTTGEAYVEWQLTQTETLALLAIDAPVDIQMRYRTTDGKAYATIHEKEKIVEINKGGEI